MEKPQEFRAKVSDVIKLNEKYNLIHLELIEPFRIKFQAGQYISLEIGRGERRAYSIASAPSEDHEVELCVDVSGQGKGTMFLNSLKPGTEVRFLGPLGRLIIGQEKKILLGATGCGIAPFKSMLLDLLGDKKDQREIWLVWGLRKPEDMFWEEEIRLLNATYPNFHYRLILSQPPEHWPLAAGHINEEVGVMELGPDWGVYLCGSKEMVDELKEIVKNKGVPDTQIHFEKF